MLHLKTTCTLSSLQHIYGHSQRPGRTVSIFLCCFPETPHPNPVAPALLLVYPHNTPDPKIQRFISEPFVHLIMLERPDPIHLRRYNNR